MKRATYEAHLARRRYEAVDPDNRLVAAELERRWEEKLLAQRQVEDEAERVQQRPMPLTLAPELRRQLEHLEQTLPTLWNTGEISNEHKKRLLRTLITRVIATRLAPDRVELKIVWVSGHFSCFTVIPPIHRQADASNYEQLLGRIRTLVESGKTDAEIVRQLNDEGYHTARCSPVTKAAVVKLRLRQGMVSTLQQYRQSDMLDGYWTVKGLAKELAVPPDWLYRCLERGDIRDPDVVREPQHGYYLIRNTPALLERLRSLHAHNTHAHP